MARVRLAVALLPSPEVAAAVDVLRSAVASEAVERVPPHLTLVPPLNARADQLGEIRRGLREAAAAARPFRLVVGPVTTFLPDSPTLHLAVSCGPGQPDALAALSALRDAVRRGPLDRPDRWAFVPHVTLSEFHPTELIRPAVAALTGVRWEWEVTDLHLLVERRVERPDGSVLRHWVPEAEEPLGGPVTVGRGGAACTLRPARMVEPAVAALLGPDAAASGPPVQPGAGRPLVVVAEEPDVPGVPIGACHGTLGAGAVALLHHLVVVEPHRGSGVARHLLGQWMSAAAAAGASVVLALDPEGEPLTGDVGVLHRFGFTGEDRQLTRTL